ncbi:hypothetical protein DTO013E5_6027 [Penicillium roqueforti]|nr:uncharacterized protein LCP9604111_6415 [Penicillium roqueforti]KAF9246655.1 hypothetical protein LCP9604111_6415 [Penicillium roqueforti]KAI2695501.1 hypothetical protein CBS147372_9130 [Penicillium roqueforti]KAI2710720.1 hypothetical protein CBS147354_8560 [Penicillium roqueforti]KAI2737007.1 hypothetical protein DTO012A1_7877 [Penicillium roqueforti]KAI2746064.1 hypothetical protein DTO013F2_7072 [Penicillium roqueforti]
MDEAEIRHPIGLSEANIDWIQLTFTIQLNCQTWLDLEIFHSHSSTMTHSAQTQQATEDIHSMFPTAGVDNMASETHVESYRSLDPSAASLEDYNRSMLEYTQRQMSSFVDTDNSRRDSRSSGKSGRSLASSGSNMSRQANGPLTPISNAAPSAENKIGLFSVKRPIPQTVI